MDFEIRKDRRPQGLRRSDPEREEHLRLVDLGIGNTEACRIIGINRAPASVGSTAGRHPGGTG
jgi:hypothetical protein